MRMSNRISSVALLLAAAGLSAQETTGTLLGAVKDSSGKAVANAHIKIVSPALLGERTITTGVDGGFRLPLLPPGNYEMSVSKDGYRGAKALLRLSAGSQVRQDITIVSIQIQQAVVEVVATAYQTDKTETVTKSSFGAEQLIEIAGPAGANGSIGYTVLNISPGVVGPVQNASIRGSGQMSNNYVVNGIASRDNVTSQARLGDYTLDDLVEDASVIQSPLNARYGNTSGGLVQLVTKRGGNEWTGTIRAKLLKESWSALRKPFSNRLGVATGSPDQPGSDDLSRTYEISVTGPIIKDHLSFTYGTRLVPTSVASAISQDLTSGGFTSIYTPSGVRPADLRQENTLEYAPDKVTFHTMSLFYQVNYNHSFEYNYSQRKETWSDIQGNAVTPDTTITKNGQTWGQYYNVGYKGLFGTNHVVEARFGLNRSNTQFISGPKPPVYLISAPSTTTGYLDMIDNGTQYLTDGATADTKPDERATQSFWVNWNSFWDLMGSHAVDIGFERQNPIWGTVSRDNSYPNQYTVPGQVSNAYTGTPGQAGMYLVIPYGATVEGETLDFNSPYTQYLIPTWYEYFGADQQDITNPTEALYINDLWALNDHFSVMGGLRYERMRLNDAIGERFNTTTLSPRFEAKWDVAGDQSRIVNLSYGEFRGLMNARYYRQYTEGRRNNQAIRYWTEGTGPHLVSYDQIMNPANYGNLASVTTSGMFDIDKNIKPEAAREITLGFKRGFSTGGFWRATMVYRTWKDLSTTFAIPETTNIPNPLDPTNPSVSYKRVWKNDPFAKRTYKGLEFEWSAPLSSAVLFAGNYTFSRLTGNHTYGDFPSFGRVQAIALPGIWRNTLAAQGVNSDMWEPEGQLAQSRNHVLKAWLTFRKVSGNYSSSVTLVGNYLSGTRSDLTNNAGGLTFLAGNPDPDLPKGQAIFFNGRGQFSQPDTYDLDLQYNLEIGISSKVKTFVQMSVNNVLNHQIPLSSSYTGLSGTTLRTLGSMANQGWFNSTAATSNRNFGKAVGRGAVGGARSFTVDLGVKF